MLSRKTRSQIIELIETVYKGVSCPNTEERAAMLEECTAALSVSEDICKKELSEARCRFYLDAIGALSAAIKEMSASCAAEELKALSKELLDWFLGELKKEPVKKEIVFLPYNASMWDSLESIWKAAYEDKEHCNAYVIPIPYADIVINDENQLEVHAWHYEKDKMPDYVPMLDCESVDLEEMHPDVIFIHNPYDDTNVVTSVEPKYYSSNLKKYTDTLAYVPYFVVGDSFNPDFATKPGVVNADYVIVQDERVKELYEKNYPGGNPPEGKFLALGSPKFDKVLLGKREDYALPEKWQKIVQGKKVVLYNTSVTTALRYTDKICDKLRFVFQSFKGRTDASLWWRPHPLMESTLRSMRPEVLAEYEELKKQYIEEGWGIYDDSADLDRAIICSDIYYGDQSSVVELYRGTGKPVMYQEMEYTEAAEAFDVPVWTQAMCSDGESLWFVEGKLNILMRYNLKSRNLICEGFLPKEARMQEYAYNTVACAKGKVFMLPSWADYIHVYDVEKKTFYELRFPLQEKYKNVPKFQGAFVYKDALYCIPYSYEYFLRIHVPSLKIEIAANAKELYQQAGLSTESLISSSDWYDDGVVAALVYQTAKIICWNLEENSFEIKEIVRSERGYGTIAFTSEHVCLAGRNADVIPTENYVKVFNRVSGEKEWQISKEFSGVKTLTKENTVLWNSETGRWAAFRPVHNDILHEGGTEARTSGALQFFYHSFICCRDEQESYGLSCHDNTFYVFDKNGKIKDKMQLSLCLAENLPKIRDFAENGNFYEIPGMLDELLLNGHSASNRVDRAFSGGKIYAAICK